MMESCWTVDFIVRCIFWISCSQVEQFKIADEFMIIMAAISNLDFLINS